MYIVYLGEVHYGQLHYKVAGFCKTEQEAKDLVKQLEYPDMQTYDGEPTCYYSKI